MSMANDIMQAIGTLQAAISVVLDGVTYRVTAAYPYVEWSVSSVNCPFFANTVEGGPTNFQATGVLQHIETKIVMYLCLQPVQQGQSLAISLAYVLEWRDAVFAAFAAHLRLALPNFVTEATITNWNLVQAQLGSTEYHALQFDLTVHEAYSLAVGS